MAWFSLASRIMGRRVNASDRGQPEGRLIIYETASLYYD